MALLKHSDIELYYHNKLLGCLRSEIYCVSIFNTHSPKQKTLKKCHFVAKLSPFTTKCCILEP